MSNFMQAFSSDKPCLNIDQAIGFMDRLVGLLSHRALDYNSGLHIPGCNAVHTIGMRFPIDVLYLDGDYKVLKIVTMSPWKVNCCVTAKSVLELNAGAAEYFNIKVGEGLWNQIGQT